MLVVGEVEQVEILHPLLELVVLVVEHQDQVALILHQTQLTLLVVEVVVQELYHMLTRLEIRLEEQVVPES